MRGQQFIEAAGAGRLDRALDGPVLVIAVLGALWLAVCVHAARHRLVAVPAGGGRRSGARRPAVRAAHATLAFLGAAGLFSQVDAATAAPIAGPTSTPASTLTGTFTRTPAGIDARRPEGRGGPAGGSEVVPPPVTLSVVTDGGEKVPSLWPVGREHIRERLAPVPGDRVVVVHRGDSLWSLARHHLEPEVPQAVVQQAVHDWYDLNESVIGPDPDLILPGQQLQVPGATQRR